MAIWLRHGGLLFSSSSFLDCVFVLFGSWVSIYLERIMVVVVVIEEEEEEEDSD